MYSIVSAVFLDATNPTIHACQLFYSKGFILHRYISYPHSPACIQEVHSKERQPRTGCCNCQSNFCKIRGSVLHSYTAKESQQRLMSHGLGTIKVCKEKKALYPRLKNVIQNNTEWLEEDKKA